MQRFIALKKLKTIQRCRKLMKLIATIITFFFQSKNNALLQSLKKNFHLFHYPGDSKWSSREKWIKFQIQSGFMWTTFEWIWESRSFSLEKFAKVAWRLTSHLYMNKGIPKGMTHQNDLWNVNIIEREILERNILCFSKRISQKNIFNSRWTIMPIMIL